MIKKLKRYLWKRRFLADLEGEAWHKEAMAFYSQATIEGLENLDGHDREARTKAELRAKELAGSTEYEKRKKLRDAEKEIEAIDAKLKGRKETKEQLRREVVALTAQAAEIRHRREVFKVRF